MPFFGLWWHTILSILSYLRSQKKNTIKLYSLHFGYKTILNTSYITTISTTIAIHVDRKNILNNSITQFYRRILK